MSSQPNLQAVAMAMAERLARQQFRDDPDREAKVFDAISVAWENSQMPPPNATAGTLARYAAQAVKTGRQFKQSAWSIDGPNPRKMRKARRSSFDPGDLSSPGEDPADIAAFRDALAVWWADLTKMQRRIAGALAVGNTVTETAAMFHCSPANVSLFRKRLMERWNAIMS